MLRVSGGQPQQNQNQFFNFIGNDGRGSNGLQVVDDDILRTSIKARNDGFSENEITNFVNSELARRQAQRQVVAAPQEVDDKRNGWLDFLLPTAGGAGGAAAGAAGGAAIGSIVPGIGTVIGGGLGAILGGALGSGGAQIANNKIQGKNFKDRLGSETLFGALGGAGKAFQVAKGAKAVASADDAARALNLTDDAADIAKIGKNNVDDLGKVAKTGRRFRLRASGLDDSKVFDTASKQFGAQEVLAEAGLKGSGRKKFEAVDGVISRISGQTDEILKRNTNTVSVKDVAKNITTKAKGEIVSDRGTFDRSLKEGLSELSKLGKGGNVTARDLNGFKKKLGDRLSLAFKKVKTGSGDLTPEQAANMSIWRALDDDIVRLAPEAKRLTKSQSVLMDAIPSLRKAAGKGVSPPLVGGVKFEMPSRIIQSFNDKLGSGLEFIGGAGSKAGGGAISRATKAALPQAAPRLLEDFLIPAGQPEGIDQLGLGTQEPLDQQAFAEFAQVNGLTPEQALADPEAVQFFNQAYRQEGLQNAGFVTDPEAGGVLTPAGFSGALNQAGITPEVVQQQVPREAIIEAIIDDFTQTGGENMGNLITFYEFANQIGDFAPPEAAGMDLTADQEKKLTGIGNVQVQLDELQQYVNSGLFPDTDNQFSANVGGIFDRTIGRFTNTDKKIFQDQLRSRGIQIIRAMGEVGNLTEAEQDAAVRNLPSPGDTQAGAQKKLDDLARMFGRVKQNVLTFGGTQPAGSSNSNDDILSGLAALGL